MLNNLHRVLVTLRLIWNQFLRNRSAMMGFTFIFAIFLIAVIGPAIRPDSSKNANQQYLSLGHLTPMAEVPFLRVSRNTVSPGESEDEFIPMENYEIQPKRVKIKIFSTNKVQEYRYFSLIDVFYAVDDECIKAFARSADDHFSFVDIRGLKHEIEIGELAEDLGSRIETKTFVLGTDHFGRDLLSRLMAGSAVSLLVGLLSTIIALLLGFIIGSLGGYFPGITEAVLGTVINVFWSIPAVMLMVAFVMLLGNGLLALSVGIGMVLWVEMAQVIRAEVMQLRQNDFILASKLLGMSDMSVIIKHVLPNVTGSMIVLSISVFAEAILLEAGLSFMGIGVQPPQPSWGNMIREAYGYAITEGAFLAFVPGLAVVFLVLSFMAISNGIKSAINRD